jgi:hypothetical protein
MTFFINIYFVGLVARIGEKRNECNVLVGKSERKNH